VNRPVDDLALAGTVGLRGVHTYLSANGWTRGRSFPGGSADVYLLPEDEQEAIIVPGSEEHADYRLRIHQLAEQLGRLERRPLRSVLADLSGAEADLLRIRLPSAQEDNSVKLVDGAAALEDAKGLLLAAACSVGGPKRAYRAGRNKRAVEYLKKVRLGQTEAGSFVINLLSPVPPVLIQAALLPGERSEQPFERQVMERLVSGLRASREVVDRMNRSVAGIADFENRLREGISANLCQSIARLAELGKGVEVSVKWAISRQEEAQSQAAVAFRPGDAPVLLEAARVLRGRQERVDELVEGYVSRLARDREDMEGTATIRAFIDGKLTSVQAVFESSDYDEITRAHRDRLSVSLEGDLRRKGQRWSLLNPRDLTVTSDDE